MFHLQTAAPPTVAPRTRNPSALLSSARVLAFAASAFVLATAAYAQRPSENLTISVVPIPGTVTHTTTKYPTYAAYAVTVRSFKPQPIVGVRFVGTTTVTAGTDTAATLAGNVGLAADACTGTTTAGTTTFSCQIGPLPANGVPKPFTVIFNAPKNGTAISLVWDIFFDESGNGGEDVGAGDPITTTLTATSRTTIDSFILPGGSTFGTGNGYAIGTTDPSTNNPSTTTVKVPGSTVATTAKIFETDATVLCAQNLLTLCYRSDITLPGTYAAGTVANFTGLVITLWRDALTMKPGAKAADFPVYYNESDVGLKLCSETVNFLPIEDVPCISSREIITRKSALAEGLPADAIGDLRIVLWALDNGSHHY